MALEVFMFKSSNEFELFTRIFEEVSKSFSTYHGQNYYFHLKNVGNKMSMIDEIKPFTDLYEFGHYLYVERDREACILFRSNKDSIAILLYGENDAGEVKITHSDLQILYGPEKSSLPAARKSQLTTIERMQAFGHIEDSLQKPKGHKAS